MSRQSDNSKGGSEGNGDSLLSSYQNSPRKTPEFGSAGPFGDHCTENKSPNCYIFMMNNDSSPESEEQQTSDLKAEYLERLNLIRQKLATIDIANYGSFYQNCYAYSSSYSPRCQITEIFDESQKGSEHSDMTTENTLTVTKPLDVKPSSTEATVNKKEEEEDTCVLKLDNESVSQDNEGEGKSDEKAEQSDHKAEQSDSLKNNFVKSREEIFNENFNSNHNNENISAVEPIRDSTTPCCDNLDPTSKIELETIFKFDNLYNIESSMDLVDLNYNPPKKKFCLREKTPRITMSDGAMSVPYHVRVGLNNNTLKSSELESLKVFESIHTQKANVENLEPVLFIDKDLNEEGTSHIFPEVQVDTFGGGDQEKIGSGALEKMRTFMEDPEAGDSPRKSIESDNVYNVFFFEAVEQSPSDSMKSNKTIITETTITTESPSRNPKRRRLLLRSAQNKVKPMDKMSLWEEIRTMDAMTKKKQGSSSSLENYFKDVIVNMNKTEPQPDMVSIGSLDVPPKTKSLLRFPSFTRITKFCSSIFRKKSQSIILEEATDENKQPKEKLPEKDKEKESIKRKVIENNPKAAHMLLNVRKDQDIIVEVDRLTPSIENYSERSTCYEEDDSYYNGLCQYCFCF